MSIKGKREAKFWQYFNNIHIYLNKGEAIFKAAVITLSWIGGVYLSKTCEKITDEIAVAFYLFSLALIMEFLIPLLNSKRIVKRILPFVLCGINFILFFCTSAVLLNRPFKNIGCGFFEWLAIISLVIIWVDVATMCLIGPNQTDHIENQLKNI